MKKKNIQTADQVLANNTYYMFGKKFHASWELPVAYFTRTANAHSLFQANNWSICASVNWVIVGSNNDLLHFPSQIIFSTSGIPFIFAGVGTRMWFIQSGRSFP